MPKLTKAQIAEALGELPGWHLKGHEIIREYKLSTYLDNLDFAAAVGRAADQADHHPDMLITYSEVRIALTTHSDGGVTDKDFHLATEADRLYEALRQTSSR